MRAGSGSESPLGSGGFGSVLIQAGIHLQTSSDGTCGQIPPRRGESVHRALCFQSRKYFVSTLGVKHFREAQETVQTAGALRLCLFISGTAEQGVGSRGSTAELRRVNTGAESTE